MRVLLAGIAKRARVATEKQADLDASAALQGLGVVTEDGGDGKDWAVDIVDIEEGSYVAVESTVWDDVELSAANTMLAFMSTLDA